MPMPRAMPLTAATNGFFAEASGRRNAIAGLSGPVGGLSRKSPRSLPLVKTSSVPVMQIARMALSVSALAVIAKILSELGLAENMRRPIREYSKGMRQRVRLGQALAHGPSFVLLDEPMTGLDPVARAELSDHIRELPKRGVGVLVSSHVLHELEAVVDRVVLVHQGRLLADGKIHELRDKLPERPHRLRLRGARPRALAAELTQWPQVEGIAVRDDQLEVSLLGQRDFYDRLTALAADWQGGLHEIAPLDDDLAAVFGYLVE